MYLAFFWHLICIPRVCWGVAWWNLTLVHVFFGRGDSAPKQLPYSQLVPSRRPRTGPKCNMDLVELACDLTRVFTPGSCGRAFPLFQGNLGWWNIIIRPDGCPKITVILFPGVIFSKPPEIFLGIVRVYLKFPRCLWFSCGGFLKWWYPQNTPKWSFLVGKTHGCWGNPPF